MTRKGKDKVPKIEPKFQPAIEAEKGLVQQQLTESERAQLAKLAPETAYVMGQTEADARQSALRFDTESDELREHALTEPPSPPPVHVAEPNPPEKLLCAWCGLEVKPIWMDRVSVMAKAKGVNVTEFMTGLIKKQWIASGAGKGKA